MFFILFFLLLFLSPTPPSVHVVLRNRKKVSWLSQCCSFQCVSGPGTTNYVQFQMIAPIFPAAFTEVESLSPSKGAELSKEELIHFSQLNGKSQHAIYKRSPSHGILRWVLYKHQIKRSRELTIENRGQQVDVD